MFDKIRDSSFRILKIPEIFKNFLKPTRKLNVEVYCINFLELGADEKSRDSSVNWLARNDIPFTEMFFLSVEWL